MSRLLDVVYLLAVLAYSPWLLYRALTTGKYRRGLGRKLLGLVPVRRGSAPCAWFHGVSVGEIHLLGPLVSCFRQRHPDWECVISSTTDTGFEEAAKRFPDLPVCYWPLDFSWAVGRAVRRINPTLLVLAEGELWPNALAAAKRHGARIAVVNGRMSPRSRRRYQYFAKLMRRYLAPVDLFAVQTEEYAACFCDLGIDPGRVFVTGSVKYDGVRLDRQNARTAALRHLLNIGADDLVWVAGSTQAPEEEIALDIFRRLRSRYPNLRLLLVPRQKDRFEEVAALLRRSGQPFVRRSSLTGPLSERSAVILVDTIGELGALWGLADVAFVGGSLDGRRGGQNMIEPAAYGAAVVFGPHVWNFRDTAARLTAAGAALQVSDPAGLEVAVQRLLADPVERQRLGQAARELIQRQQGASDRTIDCLDCFVGAGRAEKAA